MGRHRKKNKKPMTSISMEETLVLELKRAKPFNRTYSDFINTMFNEWKAWKTILPELKEQIPFMETYIKNQENKIQELNEVIEVMQKDKIEMEKMIVK